MQPQSSNTAALLKNPFLIQISLILESTLSFFEKSERILIYPLENIIACGTPACLTAPLTGGITEGTKMLRADIKLLYASRFIKAHYKYITSSFKTQRFTGNYPKFGNINFTC